MVSAPLHSVQPPSVCGPKDGSLARFHSRTTLDQLRTEPINTCCVCHMKFSANDSFFTRPLLCEIQVPIRMGIMDCAQCTYVAAIQMECRSIHIFLCFRVIQNGDWIVRSDRNCDRITMIFVFIPAASNAGPTNPLIKSLCSAACISILGLLPGCKWFIL
jgi:hypothetical protein